MKFLRVILFFLFSGLIAVGCNRHQEERRLPDQQELRKTLEETNKILLESEKQEIRDFIARYGWDMKQTGSGLWYQIYQQGEGESASAGKIAFINYTIGLLTGDMIYSSETEGAREFRIGRGGVELGLEEGILLLKEGDKARFIMPSHLAHGVPGDGVKIPARATIVYDVELIELK